MIGMSHCSMAVASALAAGDPYWNDVTCLLNFEGSNGSTSFIDSTARGTFSAYNGANITTGGPIFGTSSGNFPHGNIVDALEPHIRSNNPSLHAPTGDAYTFEVSYRPNTPPGDVNDVYNRAHTLFYIAGDPSISTDVCRLVFTSYPSLRFQFEYRNRTYNLDVSVVSSTITWVAGKVYHIKVTGDATGTRIYIDDVLSGSFGWPFVLLNTTTNISIGRAETAVYAPSRQPCDGVIDNFRITKAVRPSGSGVVPTGPFPTY